jgi:ethanolamine utilization protein EutP (predicted NTPase)
LSTFSNTNYRSVYTGNDERYSINETNNEVEIYNIYKNHENKKLLDILENDKISINTKLDLLEDNTIKPINLTAGGLMDDFNFIMI